MKCSYPSLTLKLNTLDKMAWNDKFPPLNLWNYPMKSFPEITVDPLNPGSWAAHQQFITGKQMLQQAAVPTVVNTPVKETNPKDAIGDTKVPLWLLSPVAKAQWSLAQYAGMTKYGAWNWRKAGIRTSVYLSALERHLEAYKGGEQCDPVDGTHHLGNIMACAAIILDAEAAGKLTDDRPPSVEFRNTFEQVQKQMAVLKEKYKDMNPVHYTIKDTDGNIK